MKYKLELITLLILFAFGSLFVIQNTFFQNGILPSEEKWSGTDIKAVKVIESQGYTPWFHSIWVPPGAEIETLFFCIQATIGSLLIGYFFGYNKGKSFRED